MIRSFSWRPLRKKTSTDELRECRHLAVGRDPVLQQAFRHVPEPMWKLIGRSNSTAASHNGFQCGSPSSGCAVVLRLTREEDALVPLCGAATHFLHCGGDIPERHRSDGQQAPRVGGCPLGLPVVVDLHAGEHQFGIIQLEELLRPEAADVGIHDHRPDAHFVHVFESRGGIVRPGVHALVVLGRILEAADAGGGGHSDVRHRAALSDHPSLASIGGGHHVRHAVAHAGGRATGPQVGRFGHVSIGVNDRVAHRMPLPST